MFFFEGKTKRQFHYKKSYINAILSLFKNIKYIKFIIIANKVIIIYLNIRKYYIEKNLLY